MKAEKFHPSLDVSFYGQKSNLKELSKQDFNRLLYLFTVQSVQKAVEIRTGTKLFRFEVKSINNIKEHRNSFYKLNRDSYNVDLGDILLYRKFTADDLKREICGIFIIKTPFFSKSLEAFAGTYEPFTGHLHIYTNIATDTIEIFEPDNIVGIAITSVKVAPLGDLLPDVVF